LKSHQSAILEVEALIICFIIVDEAQNLTIHEIKTIITRCGAGTKIVLLGDTDQVDTPYLDKLSNGLAIAIEKLKGKELFGHIKLDRGESVAARNSRK